MSASAPPPGLSSSLSSDLNCLKTPRLDSMTNISHGFFTRKGGASKGIYAGLNCGLGSHDDPQTVLQNRQQACKHLSPDLLTLCGLCGLYQIHSADVVTLETPWDQNDMPHADGVVTRQNGIALAILTADCVPLLFADPVAGVIGAAHAGWKGAMSGIVANTISAMETLGAHPSHIHAAIGPAIAQSSYEIGAEVFTRFHEETSDNDRFFIPSPANHDRYMFNLTGYVYNKLSRLNLASIEQLHQDTYSQESLFYSYRRTTHRGEKDYGRQLSAIALHPAEK
ncbi:MAG: polyphenol oxidase [Kordiimonas sp.]|nr:polyphenol oxidase [Kordiimonas sp.]